MKEIEIEVISTEIIKPSSPTPDRLHCYHLSFLDQITPKLFNALVLLYPSNSNTKFNVKESSNHLKSSLSLALTHYYPLAGRDKGELYIECNDHGVPFSETKVKYKLNDLVQNPIPSDLNKFIPLELDDQKTELLMAVQFNVFECNGIAIGVCISHKISDALSFFTFIQAWSAISRGESEKVSNSCLLESAKFFPQKDLQGSSLGSGTKNEINIVTKRFVFDVSAIQNLREKYSQTFKLENVNPRPPSRVESLSAFIWNRFMASVKVKTGPEKFHSVIHMVNIRSRIDPPLPEHAFGNYYGVALTVPSLDTELGQEYSYKNLLKEVREEINKVDKEFVKNMQENSVEYLDWLKTNIGRGLGEGNVLFSVSSLCRMPIYEADFGWGNPIWVGPPARTIKNAVVLMDTKVGRGIEAYVTLDRDDMYKFESDEKLLGFVSPTTA